MPRSNFRTWTRQATEGVRRDFLSLAGVGLLLLLAGVLWWQHQPHAAVPVNDLAIIELEIADFPDHWPTTGPYSRFEFHHPGPAPSYLLLPWYLLGGRDSAWLSFGALIVNLLSVGLGVWWLRPWSARGLAAGAGVGVLVVLYLSPKLLMDPWGPYMSLAPFFLFLVIMTRFVRRDMGSWLLALAVGGILIQFHVLYIPLFGLLLLVGCLAPGGGGFPLRRPGRMVMSALALLVWLPLFLDLARGRDANILEIARFIISAQGSQEAATAFFMGAQGVLAFPLTVTGFLPHTFPSRAHSEWAQADPGILWLFLLGEILLVVWLLRQKQPSRCWRLALASAVVMVWGLFSVLKVRGPILPYLLVWLTVPASALWGLAGYRWLLRMGGLRLPRQRFALGALALVAAVLAVRTPHPVYEPANPSGMVAAGLADSLLHLPAEELAAGVHFRSVDPELWGVMAGVVLQLRKSGVDVTTSEDFAVMMPEPYRATLPRKPRYTMTTQPAETRPGTTVADLAGTLVSREPLPSISEAGWDFGTGWGEPEDWGRWLRQREGNIVARLPGAGTLVLETTVSPEMVRGQELRISDNGKTVWNGSLSGKPWQWRRLEIALPANSGTLRHRIVFQCRESYAMPDGRVRPLVLPVRKVEIVTR